MNAKDLRSKFLLVCIPLSLSALLLSCKSDSQEASSPSAPDERGKRTTSHTEPAQQRAPKDPSVVPSSNPSTQPTTQSPSGRTTTAAAPKTNAPKPYVLTDLSTIKVHPGTPSPKVGDTIYTMATIPANTCGEFWVQDKDGYVSKLAQCNGQHEGGH